MINSAARSHKELEPCVDKVVKQIEKFRDYTALDPEPTLSARYLMHTLEG